MALQARLTLPEYSGLLIRRLADEGVLDPRLNFAHSVWLSREEIELLARARRRRRAQSAGQSENEMRHSADPAAAGGRRPHRPRLRQLQLLGCAEHVRRDEAVRAAGGGQRSDPRPAAGGRGDSRGDRGRRRRRAARPRRSAASPSGFKADLTLIDLNDPSWSPMNSAARQLVHVEAGRGVRTVLVDGAVVLRDRRLATVDETTIYEAVKAVMPGFRQGLRGDLRARRQAPALARPRPQADHGRRARHRAAAVPLIDFRPATVDPSSRPSEASAGHNPAPTKDGGHRFPLSRGRPLHVLRAHSSSPTPQTLAEFFGKTPACRNRAARLCVRYGVQVTNRLSKNSMP